MSQCESDETLVKLVQQVGVEANHVTVLGFFRFREIVDSGNVGYCVQLIGFTLSRFYHCRVKSDGKGF